MHGDQLWNASTPLVSQGATPRWNPQEDAQERTQATIQPTFRSF